MSTSSQKNGQRRQRNQMNGLKKAIQTKKNMGDISLSFSQNKNLKINNHIQMSRREVNLYLNKLKQELVRVKDDVAVKRRKKKRRDKRYLVKRAAHYIAYFHRFLMKYLRRVDAEDMKVAFFVNDGLKGELIIKKKSEQGKAKYIQREDCSFVHFHRNFETAKKKKQSKF